MKDPAEGGHRIVQDAADAQVPRQFSFFKSMRQTRNELLYPPLTRAATTVDAAETTERIETVSQQVDRVRELASRLAKFR